MESLSKLRRPLTPPARLLLLQFRVKQAGLPMVCMSAHMYGLAGSMVSHVTGHRRAMWLYAQAQDKARLHACHAHRQTT